MKQIGRRQIIFHPVLFAAAPVLALYTTNAEQILVREALELLLAMVLIIAVFWTFFAFMYGRRWDKGASLASLFIFTFFAYERLLPTTSPAGSLIKLLCWLGCVLAGGLFIGRSRRDFRQFTAFLNVVSLGWMAAILVPWAYYMLFFARAANVQADTYIADWNEVVNTPIPLSGERPDPSALPDIYYVIMDGYGRADALKTWYGYDNNDFLSFLKDSGFFVASESRSNYAQTALSQSSSLNFQYLDQIPRQISAQSSNRLPLEAMLESNRLFHILKQVGYRIITFPTGYLFTDIGLNVDQQIVPPGGLSSFQTELLKTTPLPNMLRLFSGKTLYDLHRERILYALAHLPEATSDAAPTLVYAHILAPHPPFVFGQNGEPLGSDLPAFSLADGNWFTGSLGHDAYIEGYRSQLIYVSSQLRWTIGQILSAARRPTIIVIQGDHGPGSMLDWEDPDKTNFGERLTILNAYYFSDQNYAGLYPGISPVNTFRVILNTYFGASLPLLDDRSYFSRMTRPYDFIDVTDRATVNP
jgi:hypothetical protein